MTTFKLDVNGKPHTVSADGDTPLLYVLRNEIGLHGPKFGCGLGQCGACTVLLNGIATRSCLLPVSTLRSANIVTLEGLGTPERPHPLQSAFIKEQAVQCGYCINGMIMSAAGLLKSNANPSESEIREALAGNLCRCGTHTRIIKAVRRAAAFPKEDI